MSETEAALYDAFVALARTLLDAGLVSESTLLEKLAEARRNADLEGEAIRASTLSVLIQSMGNPSPWWVQADRSN